MYILRSLKIQFVPQRKQRVSITKINLIMSFKEIIAVYSENDINPINTFSRQNQLLILEA
jgi:hypothetical protein